KHTTRTIEGNHPIKAEVTFCVQGVISPLLANLFLHYAFDLWMRRNFPDILFERYADDAICHCRDEDQATALRTALATRFAECGLTLHPQKTKIVYCKDQSRRENHPTFKFDFLGYTFRPRMVSKRDGGMGVSFSPAASTKALTAIRRTIRSWSMHRRSDKALDDLARMFNSHIRGWINYYGRFCPSALYPTLQRIDLTLARWASGKFKSLRGHKRRSRHWLARIARHQPRLFAHWGLLYGRGRTMGAGSCESITSGSERARGCNCPRHSPGGADRRPADVSVAGRRPRGRSPRHPGSGSARQSSGAAADAQAAQEARLCAQIAGHRQAALLRLGVPASATDL